MDPQVWIARKDFEDGEKGIVKGDLKRLRKKEKQGYPDAGGEHSSSMHKTTVACSQCFAFP